MRLKEYVIIGIILFLTGCVLSKKKGWAVQGRIKVLPEVVHKSISTKVMVTSSKNEYTYFEVLDSAHHVIRPVQIFQKTVVFDVNVYEPGTYYIRVVNKIVTFKIVQ